MPVATYGAVRGIAAADLKAIGAQILLSNTYHLHERPGEDVIQELGGLHGLRVGQALGSPIVVATRSPLSLSI